jgi:hypothetical protein
MEIVVNAQGYLEVRKVRAQDPVEQVRIEDWSRRLNERLDAIKTINLKYKEGPGAAVVAPKDEPTYVILSEQLDLSGKHLRLLHEWYDYDKVDLVMRTLNQHLGNLMLAGPHGPGKGRPGGG